MRSAPRTLRWRVTLALTLAVAAVLAMVVPGEAHAFTSAATAAPVTSGSGLSDIGLGLVLLGGVASVAIYFPRRTAPRHLTDNRPAGSRR